MRLLLTVLLPMVNAGAFAQQEAAFTGLSAKVQRALARCLCLAAVGLSDGAQRHHYVSHLLHHVAGQPLLPSLGAGEQGRGGGVGLVYAGQWSCAAGIEGGAQVAGMKRGFCKQRGCRRGVGCKCTPPPATWGGWGCMGGWCRWVQMSGGGG